MQLVPIGGGHTLREDAAASWERMRAAGCPAGPINSSTRSYAQQKDWYLHQGEPGYPAVADHPDRSKHVWRPTSTTDTGGRALDLTTQVTPRKVAYRSTVAASPSGVAPRRRRTSSCPVPCAAAP
ncbi:M15 family metallopeptidase [Cellulomonas composti]|uniref:M15 family metallopeptidase n=1 Tax=Cellulomonas composti TaxID=266130 RepID=UPI0011BDB8CA|nr:M15 family metallopeptidase [Cellulomonas composti]